MSKHGVTERERQVLCWLIAGRTAKDIGTILAISPRTVNVHVQAIYRKLGVNNRAELVQAATSMGIEPADGGIGVPKDLRDAFRDAFQTGQKLTLDYAFARLTEVQAQIEGASNHIRTLQAFLTGNRTEAKAA